MKWSSKINSRKKKIVNKRKRLDKVTGLFFSVMSRLPESKKKCDLIMKSIYESLKWHAEQTKKLDEIEFKEKGSLSLGSDEIDKWRVRYRAEKRGRI